MATQPKDTIKALPLECITIDPKLQMREEIDQEHVETLTAVLADKKELHGDLPVVFQEGTTNWLADGFHRWRAHQAAGINAMQCLVKQGAFRDAQKFALSANARHGKKRTTGDVAKAIKTALADPEWSKLSQAAIADLCDCNHAWVSRVQGKLSTIDSQESNTPPEDVSEAQKQRWTEIVAAGGKPCLGKDRRVYNTSNIGRRTELTAVEKQPDPKRKAITDERSMTGATGIYDAKNRPIPEYLVDVWETATELRAKIEELAVWVTSWKNAMLGNEEKGVKRKRGLVWVDVRKLATLVDDQQRTIRFGMPYIVCPACDGQGVAQGQPCNVCRQTGFLPEQALSSLGDELIERACRWQQSTPAA